MDPHGLRNEHPLFPILYIIMVENVSKNLEMTRDTSLLPGLRITRNVKKINHSQFASDTLLLGGEIKITSSQFKEALD